MLKQSVRLALTLVTFALSGCGEFCPPYHVYEQEMAGKAELARAESNRKITVLEAESKKLAAKQLAEAEVERAKGVAEANKIIGESLRGHDEYLQYLWITGLESGTGRETVYIPTEAGLPILESSRLNRGESKK
jgi:regulator of protease activity HflC (stomatin/prohibitin superfamily)